MTGGGVTGASGWGLSHSHLSGGNESFTVGSPGNNTNNTTNNITAGAGGSGVGGGSSMMTSEKDRERDSVRQIVTQLRQVVIYLHIIPFPTHPISIPIQPTLFTLPPPSSLITTPGYLSHSPDPNPNPNLHLLLSNPHTTSPPHLTPYYFIICVRTTRSFVIVFVKPKVASHKDQG